MKVLYIATSFPEPQKGATIYTDLAEALHGAGHEITVVVSEQKRNKEKTELGNERGFEVLRVVTGNYYDVSLIEKGITSLRMPLVMKKEMKRHLQNRKFDFILFESPPVTNASLVAWAKRHFNCPAYLMLKDIFPQNAADLGIMKKSSPIYTFFSKKEKALYRTADWIGVMSEANRNFILANNESIDPKKVEIFPNTKKVQDIMVAETNLVMREKLGIPKQATVFLFGGNMGRPQYIELLCEAVKECKEEQDIFFLFIGRGTDRYRLDNVIKEHEIKNALLLENLPRDKFEQITREIDVGLIILDSRFTIPNYPSRILSYMEYGKPVLAATDRVTDIKELIEDANCGEWVWSGDSKAFIESIRKMSANESLSSQGQNGRKYLEQSFTVERSVKILEKHFN
ncbi:Glycosyltransferase involved in cell wall bisynthesis [Bhargavaea beijingensis]|uniref:Glycosyltransferase involved in cell wall bisynthesis n=1 Tax=Bhargavaea beijingensis TaxID=426756 RepID=A0A1G6Z981_9BACL|nr:glycosyltransferase family 4 protein [Bhargavaea beijingensis]SDD99150.1 Glycosyltransferase involved in cell wall bisynthesis [Bhargavaea beijingensis]